MKDATFLVITLAVAVVLASLSIILQLETLTDPTLLVLFALGGGLAGWGFWEDRRPERKPLDY